MSVSLGVAMGRKRKQVQLSADTRVAVIHLKDTPEYREWVNMLSERTLIPATAIIRDALADWAAKKGLPPPPRSVGRSGRKD